MAPTQETLVMYGARSEVTPLAWSWVDDQLTAAGTYWVTPPGTDHPHSRPVWGVWSDDRLHLSIGSPAIARGLDRRGPVTVHLDSGVDVVILEGHAVGPRADRAVIARYDAKYDWTYDVAEYGPLTVVEPSRVLAWRSAGWAGREGFQQTGRWRY